MKKFPVPLIYQGNAALDRYFRTRLSYVGKFDSICTSFDNVGTYNNLRLLLYRELTKLRSDNNG